MRQLFMRQKAFTLRGNFTVTDIDENDVYFVEGSFMQIPKRFIITDIKRQAIGEIVKKPISFLATFFVDVYGQDKMTIKQQFSFIKARYVIEGAGIEVRGNWWDMDFEVLRNGEVVGVVNKKWFTWGSTYVLSIYDEEIETLLVSLVVAINYVKMSQNAAASGGGA